MALDATPKGDEIDLQQLAGTLSFHRNWTFYIKFNHSGWEKLSFKNLYKIRTIKDMWQVLNNVPNGLTGVSNIFFMENDVLPLWEEDKELWSKGGCWSTIIKGSSWIDSMKEICMLVFGESVFEDHEVKGVCVVPVGARHCIIKLWCTSSSETIGAQLKSSLEDMSCCQPRFKAFS